MNYWINGWWVWCMVICFLQGTFFLNGIPYRHHFIWFIVQPWSGYGIFPPNMPALSSDAGRDEMFLKLFDFLRYISKINKTSACVNSTGRWDTSCSRVNWQKAPVVPPAPERVMATGIERVEIIYIYRSYTAYVKCCFKGKAALIMADCVSNMIRSRGVTKAFISSLNIGAPPIYRSNHWFVFMTLCILAFSFKNWLKNCNICNAVLFVSVV